LSIKRQFSKPAFTVRQHVDMLTERGLGISDQAECERALRMIGYYRLSGYMLPLQVRNEASNQKDFKPDTCFSDILSLYDFDRKLRSVLLDTLERIEIAMRVATCDTMAIVYGPHWYMSADCFSPDFRHEEYLDDLKLEIGHGEPHRRSVSNRHYYENYDAPEMPPCWMAFEAISFGKLARTIRNLKKPDRTRVARILNLGEPILASWCLSLSNVRNHCAHHERVWNRSYTIRPMISTLYKAEMEQNDTCYAQLVCMHVIMKTVSPKSRWQDRIADIMAEHPDVPLAPMGLPPDWQSRPFWR
jgi:abortive infection bacteriophage resistance protein